MKWVGVMVLVLVSSTWADAPKAKLPAIDDLPKLALARPAPAKVAASAKLNTDGYKLHVAKDFAGAATKYKAAAVADPGNLLARYNLASVLVSAGDAAHGLQILAQFKAVADCRACVGILIHAKTDAEWASQTAAPEFIAATKDAIADTIDLKKLATQVVDAMGGGKVAGLAPYFHPRQAPRLMVAGHEQLIFETPEELAKFGKKRAAGEDVGVELRVPDTMTCSAKTSCCTFTGPPSRSDTLQDLDSICFEGVGDVLFLGRIDVAGSYLQALPLR